MASGALELMQDDSRAEILRAAATCFMERGYSETSIDDVARALGATKGRIYHYFRSKADLFAGVFRAGMEMNYAAVEPLRTVSGSAAKRWQLMATAHVLQMIDTKPFQRTVWMGVEMHLRGATTPEQRNVFSGLIQYRSDYGDLFRQVILDARDEGEFDFEDLSIANQMMFMTLNSPIFWYGRRTGETREDVEKLAQTVVTCAWRGLGGAREGERS